MPPATPTLQQVPYVMVGNGKFPAYFNLVLTDAYIPVRDQRTCGSCWSFATTASISSVYSKLTGTQMMFSNQFLMDCLPSSTLTKQEGGVGCWGGSFPESLDFLIGSGQVMPLNVNYPYAGVQGQCDR